MVADSTSEAVAAQPGRSKVLFSVNVPKWRRKMKSKRGRNRSSRRDQHADDTLKTVGSPIVEASETREAVETRSPSITGSDLGILVERDDNTSDKAVMSRRKKLWKTLFRRSGGRRRVLENPKVRASLTRICDLVLQQQQRENKASDPCIAEEGTSPAQASDSQREDPPGDEVEVAFGDDIEVVEPDSERAAIVIPSTVPEEASPAAAGDTSVKSTAIAVNRDDTASVSSSVKAQVSAVNPDDAASVSVAVDESGASVEVAIMPEDGQSKPTADIDDHSMAGSVRSVARSVAASVLSIAKSVASVTASKVNDDDESGASVEVAIMDEDGQSKPTADIDDNSMAGSVRSVARSVAASVLSIAKSVAPAKASKVNDDDKSVASGDSTSKPMSPINSTPSDETSVKSTPDMKRQQEDNRSVSSGRSECKSFASVKSTSKSVATVASAVKAVAESPSDEKSVASAQATLKLSPVASLTDARLQAAVKSDALEIGTELVVLSHTEVTKGIKTVPTVQAKTTPITDQAASLPAEKPKEDEDTILGSHPVEEEVPRSDLGFFGLCKCGEEEDAILDKSGGDDPPCEGKVLTTAEVERPNESTVSATADTVGAPRPPKETENVTQVAMKPLFGFCTDILGDCVLVSMSRKALTQYAHNDCESNGASKKKRRRKGQKEKRSRTRRKGAKSPNAFPNVQSSIPREDAYPPALGLLRKIGDALYVDPLSSPSFGAIDGYDREEFFQDFRQYLGDHAAKTAPKTADESLSSALEQLGLQTVRSKSEKKDEQETEEDGGFYVFGLLSQLGGAFYVDPLSSPKFGTQHNESDVESDPKGEVEGKP